MLKNGGVKEEITLINQAKYSANGYPCFERTYQLTRI